MFYSASTRGFYHSDIHIGGIPSDAVELTQEEYEALMRGQAEGLQIVADEHGRPALIARAVNHTALIADRRYQAEISGITSKGIELTTDRDSQALLTCAAFQAMINPAYHCQWKTPAGFVDLDAQQLIALASATRVHVQACFDREAELLAHLEAGTFTERMLDEGWPT